MTTKPISAFDEQEARATGELLRGLAEVGPYVAREVLVAALVEQRREEGEASRAVVLPDPEGNGEAPSANGPEADAESEEEGEDLLHFHWDPELHRIRQAAREYSEHTDGNY